MDQNLSTPASNNQRRKRNAKRWEFVVWCTALVIPLCTMFLLMRSASALEAECGQEEHLHSKSCFEVEEVLTCGQEEGVTHSHTKSCYVEERTLTCEEEEHLHTEACYVKEE
jgi:hypothetical protein